MPAKHVIKLMTDPFCFILPHLIFIGRNRHTPFSRHRRRRRASDTLRSRHSSIVDLLNLISHFLVLYHFLPLSNLNVSLCLAYALEVLEELLDWRAGSSWRTVLSVLIWLKLLATKTTSALNICWLLMLLWRRMWMLSYFLYLWWRRRNSERNTHFRLQWLVLSVSGKPDV
jgi:hypothetical protein